MRRNEILVKLMQGILANPAICNYVDSGKDRLATRAAKLALEATDELIRLDSEKCLNEVNVR